MQSQDLCVQSHSSSTHWKNDSVIIVYYYHDTASMANMTATKILEIELSYIITECFKAHVYARALKLTET